MLRKGCPVVGKKLNVLRSPCGTSASPTTTRSIASAMGAAGLVDALQLRKAQRKVRHKEL